MVSGSMRRVTGIVVGLIAAVAGFGPTAVAAASGSGIAYVTGSATSAPSVWVANGGGRHARRLGPGDLPVLSPDGRTIAASNEASSGHALILYPASGGAGRAYFNLAQVSADALTWSPDSRYLAVALSGVNVPSLTGYGLAIIDTKTGAETVIRKGVIYGASFAPGPSDKLVYARAVSLLGTAAVNLFTVAASGTGTTQITRDGRSANPVWGKRGIAFDHEQFRPGFAPIDQIWLMRPDGSHRTQITHTTVGPLVEGLVPLAFSADGTRLAAEFEGQDTSVGYSVSILNGHSTQLKVGNMAVSAWGISRSGRSVLISVGGFMQPPSQGRIEQIPFSGGHASLLIAHGAFPSWNL